MTWSPKLGLIIGSTALVSGLVSAVLFNGVVHGEWDLPGLQQQVQHLTETSDNHEVRITNVENKVNTPADQPTPTPQVVTRVVTAPAPSATPAPVLAAATTPSPTPAPTITEKWLVTCWSGPTNYTWDRLKYVYLDGTAKSFALDGVTRDTQVCYSPHNKQRLE